MVEPCWATKNKHSLVGHIIGKSWNSQILENSIITENMFPISLKSFHLLLKNTYGRWAWWNMTQLVFQEKPVHIFHDLQFLKFFNREPYFLGLGCVSSWLCRPLAVGLCASGWIKFWQKNISNFKCTSDVIPCHSFIFTPSHISRSFSHFPSHLSCGWETQFVAPTGSHE